MLNVYYIIMVSIFIIYIATVLFTMYKKGNDTTPTGKKSYIEAQKFLFLLFVFVLGINALIFRFMIV